MTTLHACVTDASKYWRSYTCELMKLAMNSFA